MGGKVVEFNYQLTRLDAQEALSPPIDAAGRVVQQSPWKKLVSLAVMLALLSLCILFRLFARRFALVPAPPQAQLPPELDNLWLTLVPSLLPAALLLLIVVAGMVLKARSARAQSLGAMRLLVPVATAVMGYSGLHAMDDPQWAIPWNPTPGKIELVAFAPWIVLFVALVLYGLGSRRRKTNAAWNVQASLKRPKTFIADEEGVEIIDELYRISCRWAYFKRFAETPNLLLLYLEDGRTMGVPKRAIATESDHLELRRLLHERIGRGTFLPTQPGFAVIPQPVEAIQ